ncbi:peptide ABC transporter substrate-binding protein [Sporolactobacillus spathodeae]|uniref:Oligopeptide transport system substrate-binding protein n=1 Tax=Sporolactobacillus spathodeae TaxID=1465502 RepID=A0ABS2Q500_9BACL|nr:peptide ABC transporter substrate-binding protein [Sporolactobacillus spathodeae]MBM7656681.1 oligopeptide transport system substrate-binding protein [Sporolactobacillus spathodeae]
MQKTKWAKCLAPLALVPVLVLSACSGSGSSASSSSNQLAAKQVLRVTTTSDIPTLDYTQATDTQSTNVLEMVNSGLTRMHDNKVQWDLASGAKVSSDKKTYTFTLRRGIKWSDGKPITAQNFVYGWQHENDPKAKPAYNFLYASAGIKNAEQIENPKDPMYGKYQKLGIKAIGTDKVQVTFSKPAPPFFLSLLSTPGFFPQRQDFITKEGKNYAMSPDALLYDGPFKLQSWNKGSGWTYVKNNNYWDAKKIHLTNINIKISTEEATRVNLYKTGATDTIESVSGDFADQLKKTIPKEVHYGLTSTTRFLYVNQKTNKYLRNAALRKALSESINRQAFVTQLMKNGSVPSNFAVPKDFVKGPDGKDFRTGTPTGYPMGSEAQAQKDWATAKKELKIKTLNLNFLTQDGDQLKNFDQYLAGQFEKLKGVHVTINQQPFANFLKLQTDFKFDLSYAGWAPDYQDPMTYLDMFTTGHPENSSGWSNTTYDKLIASAEKEANVSKRWRELQQAEKILIKDNGIIPLDQDGQVWTQKPYVKGLQYPVYGPVVDFTGAYITKH